MNRLLTVMLLLLITAPAFAQQWACQPTRPDADGPYYKKDAPVRNSVGEGFLLFGEVKSAADCNAIAQAKIEVWMAGPAGRYLDRWRATLYADKVGRYWYETDFPGNYGSRPPHIHIIANAPGYLELVTQYYPKQGTGEAQFDLILIPETTK